MASLLPSPNDPSESADPERSLASCVKDLCVVLERVHLVVNRLDSKLAPTTPATSRETVIPIVAPLDSTLAPADSQETVPRTRVRPTSMHSDEYFLSGSSDDEPDASVSSNSFVIPASTTESNESMWYCITVGRRPGVYHGPSDVTPNINRVPGNQVTKHKTRVQAVNSFFSALDRGLVEKVSMTVTRSTLDGNDPSLYYLAPPLE
ncbi:hypothetical protein CPC08DRAFT_767778 [Agrocybe pediades]|nr:hypothetical protein CPC08DRAFT_767778 [Agrocybe pediades]